MIDVGPHTVFVTLAGSHAHGTARPTSDVDLRGVFVAPLATRLSLFQTIEQSEGPLGGALAEQVLARLRAHPTAVHGLDVKLESSLFDVAKFLSLCALANPNALEVLFADEQDWLHHTPTWRRIHDARYHFLTRKVQHTFAGYALAQLKRIRTHRSWLMDPPKRKPSRQDFGLPSTGTLSRDDQDRIELGVAEKMRSYGIDDLDLPKPTRLAIQERLVTFWADVLGTTDEVGPDDLREVASQALHLPREVVSALRAERKYRAAMKHWEAYEQWRQSRNPARAALEHKHGYDTKHAMHLVRLMRTGLEALTTGELRVRRPDAQELMAIRDGALSYDDLLGAAQALQTQMEAAAQSTALPQDVDPTFVDGLAFDLLR